MAQDFGIFCLRFRCYSSDIKIYQWFEKPIVKTYCQAFLASKEEAIDIFNVGVKNLEHANTNINNISN